MKIAVIGCGFVGGTVADFLEEHTVKDGVEVIRCDPFKYEGGIEYQDLRELDGAIFCLNAATMDSKEVDLVPTIKAITEVLKHNPDVEIMVKSTIPMFTKLTKSPADGDDWNERIVYNPEFLREKTAKEDFANQPYFIVGIAKHLITYSIPAEDNPHAKFWTNLFAPSLPNTEFIYTDRETAVMVKYTHNAWLATKVTFFHSLSLVMPGLSNYEEMTNILAKFPNIGPSHMKVPNALGELGYEGFCFPKDMKAFSEITHSDHSDLIEDIIRKNEKIKKKTNHPQALDSRILPKLIPQEDFIICIGTSHTAGECEGNRVDSYAIWVEKILGIKVIEIGYSGASNIDLLACLTELNDWGFLNDRCKLVTLEPRLTDSTMQNSIDSVIGVEKTIQYLTKDTLQDSHLCRTSLLRPHDTDKNQFTWTSSVREGIVQRIGPGNIAKAAEGLKNKVNRYENDKKKISIDIDSELIENVKPWMAYMTHNLAYNKTSFLAARNDLQLIQSMSIMVKNAGIPFRWFLMDDRQGHIHTLRHQIEKSSSIFKDMLLTKSIQHLVVGGDNKKRPWHENCDKELVCKCLHFSAKGNEHIAKNFIAPAIKRTLNKVSGNEK